MVIVAIGTERFQLLWSFGSADYRQLLPSGDVTLSSIFAATVCRFLAETNGNPRRRLNDILIYNVTHLPIINHLFSGHEEREEKKVSIELRNIVGSIQRLWQRARGVGSVHDLVLRSDRLSCENEHRWSAKVMQNFRIETL